MLWKEVRSKGVDESADDDDEDGGGCRMFARAFSVFNASQVDGYEMAPPPVIAEGQRLAHADAFIANLGIKTEFGWTQAYYRPSTDTVAMPPFEFFNDAASFYGMWLHEHGHAAGAKHRLD